MIPTAFKILPLPSVAPIVETVASVRLVVRRRL